MYRFLEEKPVVVVGNIVNSKARSWVATLQDGRLTENHEAVGPLQIALLNTVNQETKGAIKNVEKLLIVTCASSTQIFITLFQPSPTNLVKRLLENLLKDFGEHVSLRALQSVHMMNDRDESTIQACMMAGEFEEEQTYQNAPSRKEDLHLLQGALVKYRGAQGYARVETQLSTMTNQIGELENQLAALSSERDEHSLGQRINQCSDPKEREWLEAVFAAESDFRNK